MKLYQTELRNCGKEAFISPGNEFLRTSREGFQGWVTRSHGNGNSSMRILIHLSRNLQSACRIMEQVRFCNTGIIGSNLSFDRVGPPWRHARRRLHKRGARFIRALSRKKPDDHKMATKWKKVPTDKLWMLADVADDASAWNSVKTFECQAFDGLNGLHVYIVDTAPWIGFITA